MSLPYRPAWDELDIQSRIGGGNIQRGWGRHLGDYSEQPVHLSRSHRTRLVQIARCAMPSRLCHFSVTPYYVKMVYTGFIPSQFSSLPFWFSQTTLE